VKHKFCKLTELNWIFT